MKYKDYNINFMLNYDICQLLFSCYFPYFVSTINQSNFKSAAIESSTLTEKPTPEIFSET